MRKLLLLLFIVSAFNSKGTIHQIQVWNGYYQFLPPSNITVQLGDTVQWIPLDPPTMTHTITSDNIPAGAASFNQIWQLPADTFFQYIPQVVGLYQYVCTPHINFNMIGEFTVVNGSTTQTYVPDDNFEQELINLGYDNVLDDYVLTANINTITYLNISSENISDLTGIEDFTALIDLHCYNNQLTSLDVSNNTALTLLYCYDNQLTSLDVSQNTALTLLYCYENQLTSLDVSQNTMLSTLDCHKNDLTSLDVSNNINLENLYCHYQLLTSLDITNNQLLIELDCHGNQIPTLDINNHTSLTFLDCSYNQLTDIDISSNPNIITFICNSNPQLISLDVKNSNNINMTYVIMSQNPNLSCINVDDTTWSNFNWTVSNGNIDPQHYFSNNCSATSVEEHSINKQLLKVTDLLGRETKQKNQPLFYIYDDGTVEKKINIE